MALYIKESNSVQSITIPTSEYEAMKEQIAHINSILIPGPIKTVEDPVPAIGLTVTYRITIYSTEVFVQGNLTNNFQFNAWQAVDLGWIPMPNRPSKVTTQFILDPFYIMVQTDGQVQIASSETRKGSGLYIDGHIVFFNAGI